MGATVGTHWHGSLAVATFCQAQPGSAARGSAQGCQWAHVWVGSADQDSCTLHLLSDYGAEAESDFGAAAVRTLACHRDGCQKASCLLLLMGCESLGCAGFTRHLLARLFQLGATVL